MNIFHALKTICRYLVSFGPALPHAKTFLCFAVEVKSGGSMTVTLTTESGPQNNSWVLFSVIITSVTFTS